MTKIFDFKSFCAKFFIDLQVYWHRANCCLCEVCRLLFNFWSVYGNAVQTLHIRLRSELIQLPLTGDKQTKWRSVYVSRREGVLSVSPILWDWTSERSALWTVAVRSEEESGAFGPGQDGVWGAEHDRAHGFKDTDAHAKPHKMPASAGKLTITVHLRLSQPIDSKVYRH